MSSASYNLLDEPWIEVLDLAGEQRAVSLTDALLRSHDIAEISGDIFTQDVAILRLLLAVVNRVVLYEALDADDPVDYWKALYTAPTLPGALIREYLERHRDRFFLRHPHTPFFQVPDDGTNKTSGLQKLIADLPDTPDKQLFSTRSGAGAVSLSLAEAARWLVHAHAFDPSGIKTGLVGDPRVKGGKTFPHGLGWSGNCGLLMAAGPTLKETLLLNLVLSRLDEKDAPPWELPPDGPAPRQERRGVDAVVKGPIQAMTWQTRRVILHYDGAGDRVVDVTLGNGDRVEPQNRWDIEDHVTWRYSANKSKNSDVYFPRAVDPERGLWRGVSGILATQPTRGRVTGKPAPQHSAGIVSWLHLLLHERALPENTRVPLTMTGAIYGTQNSVIDDVRRDVLALPRGVLVDERLRLAAVNAVYDAEAAVLALRGLARDLARAAGLDEGDGIADDIARRAYFALGSRYQKWLLTLSDPVSAEEKERDWQGTVRAALLPLADDLIRDSGSAAFTGRTVERLGGRTEHLDVGSASSRFIWALKKALPLLQQSAEVTPDTTTPPDEKA